MRAVLPKEPGAAPSRHIEADFAGYKAAGVTLFGLGSSLFKPGMTATEAGARARAAAAAWDLTFAR